MKFVRSAVKPQNKTGEASYFCFYGEDVLVARSTDGGGSPLLTAGQAKAFGFQEECFIGFLNDRPCYAAAIAEKAAANGYQWVGLREIYLKEEPGVSQAVGYARQVVDWNRNFRFCGRCAGETVVLRNEHARHCETCGLISYPRISPAVIVAVLKGDQILLARSAKFSDPQMYSVLAGFLEPGESLEECLEREVLEEVGIAVTNVRYFKSQPWPFPDCLMVGFTAEYRSGEIQVDGEEITEAGWFKAGALPKVPTRRSISSELIKWFCEHRLKYE